MDKAAGRFEADDAGYYPRLAIANDGGLDLNHIVSYYSHQRLLGRETFVHVNVAGASFLVHRDLLYADGFETFVVVSDGETELLDGPGVWGGRCQPVQLIGYLLNPSVQASNVGLSQRACKTDWLTHG